MTVNHYNWKNGPAEIQQHSVAKLDVLRAYLIQYFKTLASLPQQDVFKLTLVDGFAGGGLYIHKDKQEFVHGSPLVCLEAVQEAGFLLNQDRKKGYTDLMVAGAPSPHQSDTTLRWLIDRLRS